MVLLSTVERKRGLVMLARSGDANAFRQLVEECSRQYFALALTIARSREDAEDSLQDAWLRAWKSLQTLRDADRFDPWFRQIVVRVAIRRANASKGYEHRSDDFDETSDGMPFERTVESHDEVDRLLDGLAAVDRALLSLRYFADLTVPDVATALGLSQGTVKSRLSRLLSRLRQEAGSDNVD